MFLDFVYMSSIHFSIWSLSGHLAGAGGRQHIIFSYGFSRLIVQPM